jgi:hypothetical protein
LILAHIDRLRRYDGEVPDAWRSAPKVVDSTIESTTNNKNHTESILCAGVAGERNSVDDSAEKQ